MSSRYHRYKSPIRKRSPNRNYKREEEFHERDVIYEHPSRYNKYENTRDFDEPIKSKFVRDDYQDHKYKDNEELYSERGSHRSNRNKRLRSKSPSRDRKFSYEPPQESVQEFKFERRVSSDPKESLFVSINNQKSKSDFRPSNDRFASLQLPSDNRSFETRANQKIPANNSIVIGNNNHHFIENNSKVTALEHTRFPTPPKFDRSFIEHQEISQPDTFVPSFNQEVFAPNDSFVRGGTTNNVTDNNSESAIPLIPDFNPDSTKLDSQKWINLIEETSKKQGWKDDEKQYIMTSRMTGFASQWYLSTGIHYRAWKDLTNAFVEAFPGKKDFYVLLKSMMARKKSKDESISEYFHHKVALLNACQIYGENAVSCIIGGLTNEKLKEDATLQNFNDPDALYLYLRPTEVEKAKSASPPPPITNKKWKSKLENKVCFCCGQKGHVAAQCENPTNLTTEVEPNTVEEVASASKLARERITEVKIKDIIMKAYIDRSSECTTIREDSFKACNLPFTRKFQSIRGHNNFKMPSYGFVDCLLSVDRAVAKLRMFIVGKNAHPVPVIVGKSFIDQHHIYVMNSEEKMRIYQKMDNGSINFDF